MASGDATISGYCAQTREDKGVRELLPNISSFPSSLLLLFLLTIGGNFKFQITS